ncbi:MAG: Transcriptional regulator, LuxR family protein [Phycisphaerales bacterium]|nr:Transcriptional regulator, LuxR family protein [Phycisphaerales bacterium]
MSRHANSRPAAGDDPAPPAIPPPARSAKRAKPAGPGPSGRDRDRPKPSAAAVSPLTRRRGRPAASPVTGRNAVDLATAARVVRGLRPADESDVDVQRQLLATLLRWLGDRHFLPGPSAAPAAPPLPPPVASSVQSPPSGQPPSASPPGDPLVPLSPRARQKLDRLLCGDSEKQVARHLGLSRHTVHVYEKTLYRKFDVRSRGELLAKFVGPPPTPDASP